jgi:hypothetical protein
MFVIRKRLYVHPVSLLLFKVCKKTFRKTFKMHIFRFCFFIHSNTFTYFYYKCNFTAVSLYPSIPCLNSGTYRSTLSCWQKSVFCVISHHTAAVYTSRLALNFWHQSFTFNSYKSPTWCSNFSVYYPDVCLQLNMFRAFSRPSLGAQWLQWQPLVLHSYRGVSRVVFVVGPPGQTSG